jgi:hypothetical protein
MSTLELIHSMIALEDISQILTHRFTNVRIHIQGRMRLYTIRVIRRLTNRRIKWIRSFHKIRVSNRNRQSK